jgi:murein DD-endopeptidase MepM/ murein hydrolase activator NlpD
MLKARKAAKDKLTAEVQDIESQIKFILDPATIPTAGSGVFRWPVEKPYITQYFGYTKFALTTNAYKNNMHNGMDLGAPVGTKIYAPLGGTVRMTGNTDLVPGCYSWGKWALIDHPNGLSSLFAHMSQIAVSPGQKVNTSDIVGYVGNTGYSTGPHLHFTVYVTAGVQVKQFNQFKAVTGCGAALSPFAAVEAYQDPLKFLPKL